MDSVRWPTIDLDTAVPVAFIPWPLTLDNRHEISGHNLKVTQQADQQLEDL